MKQIPNGWTISERDGDHTKLNHNKSHLVLTKEEKEKIKQEIIENHEKLRLDENLKYEIYPELFK